MIRHFWLTGLVFVSGLTAYAGYIGHLTLEFKQDKPIAVVRPVDLDVMTASNVASRDYLSSMPDPTRQRACSVQSP